MLSCGESLQTCPAVCDPVDCSPLGSSAHRDSPSQNTRVGCYVLLQGIFPTQESNPALLHCRWILYRLSHQGSLSIMHKLYYIFNFILLITLKTGGKKRKRKLRESIASQNWPRCVFLVTFSLRDY